MDGNRIDKNTNALETEVEGREEESSSINQINDSDATLQTNKSYSGTLRERQGEEDSLVEAPRSDLNGSCNVRPDGLVDQIASTPSLIDNQSMIGESDLPSTPLANLRRVNFSQSSSLVEVSSKDLSLSPLPRARKGQHSCFFYQIKHCFPDPKIQKIN